MKQLAMDIYEKRMSILDAKNKLADLELAKKNKELTRQLEVSEAVAEDGKKKYTNETQRKKAVEEILKEDSVYQEAIQKIKDMSISIAREEISVEYLKNKLRIELAENTQGVNVELKQ